MADILIIAPSREIADLARESAGGDTDIAVAEARLDAGVATGRSAALSGARVLVSRGLTYRMLAAALPESSIVEITYSGHDLLRAALEASRHPGPAAVVDYPAVLEALAGIEAILGTDRPTMKIAIDETRGFQAAVKTALARGAACVIGNQAVVHEAVEAGAAGVLLRSGREAVDQAVFAALRLLELHRLRDLSARQTDIVINAVDYGLIAIDDNGDVTAVNSEARRLLGPTPGSGLLESLRRSLADGRHLTGAILKQADGNALVVDYRPIAVAGRTIGAVATFQELSRLQAVEHKTRHELARRGFVARHTFADIASRSPAMQEVTAQARRFARIDATILITGETGVGKEYFAHAIHHASPRRVGPFVAVNCAAIPETILESELFGYAEGAFTGARKGGKVGLFEQAHGGTIFLDEIGDMSAHLQARLLRVLQEYEVYRLGDDRIIPVDIRVIAATNRDLWAMVAAGRFREDLYHRLDALRVDIPSLRERRSDIADYADKFRGELAAKYRVSVQSFDEAALDQLAAHHWPGNLRELHNVVGRLVVLAPSSVITAPLVEKVLAGRCRSDQPRPRGLKAVEEAAIREALAKAGGNKRKAAELLGIGRATLWRRLRHLDDNVST